MLHDRTQKVMKQLLDQTKDSPHKGPPQKRSETRRYDKAALAEWQCHQGAEQCQHSPTYADQRKNQRPDGTAVSATCAGAQRGADALNA